MNKHRVLCLNVKFVQLVDNTDSYKIRLRVRILKGKGWENGIFNCNRIVRCRKIEFTINALEGYWILLLWIISHQSLWFPSMICVKRAKEDFSRVAVVTDIRGGALSDKFFEF